MDVAHLLRGCLLAQELTEVIGRSQGVVIMTPPRECKEAQAALSTMLAALKSKHKVHLPAAQAICVAQQLFAGVEHRSMAICRRLMRLGSLHSRQQSTSLCLALPYCNYSSLARLPVRPVSPVLAACKPSVASEPWLQQCLCQSVCGPKEADHQACKYVPHS